jgi:ATP-dependent Clp protease ATP-binding subunit ClpA
MVVDKFVSELQQQLNRKKVVIKISEKTRNWLSEHGFDPLYGARPLGRLIQTEIKDVLSEEVLFGRLIKGGNVYIDVDNEKLTFNYPG